MTIEYRIRLDDNKTAFTYVIATDKDDPSTTRAETPAEWTRLTNNQCSNCPLNKSVHEHCPAAIDLQKVVEDFGTLPAVNKARFTVVAPERQYYKHTDIEEGLRSMMGLLMASSGCPILNKLKPMASTHLPFATQKEFIMRSVGTYLIRQYYHEHFSGKKADWSLSGLVHLNEELRLVNQAMWQRVYSACKGDSNLKALLSFFTMASSVSHSLESQLSKFRSGFLEETDMAPYDRPSS